MYHQDIKAKALKESKELEKQINELIADYETRWKKHWTEVTLIPISEIKNNLPYIVQNGGRVQFYLKVD